MTDIHCTVITRISRSGEAGYSVWAEKFPGKYYSGRHDYWHGATQDALINVIPPGKVYMARTARSEINDSEYESVEHRISGFVGEKFRYSENRESGSGRRYTAWLFNPSSIIEDEQISIDPNPVPPQIDPVPPQIDPVPPQIDPVPPQIPAEPTARADINRDGVVDFDDVSIFGVSYGSQYGDEKYNPAADLNLDNRVDQADMDIMDASYGRFYPVDTDTDTDTDIDTYTDTDTVEDTDEKKPEKINWILYLAIAAAAFLGLVFFT